MVAPLADVISKLTDLHNRNVVTSVVNAANVDEITEDNIVENIELKSSVSDTANDETLCENYIDVDNIGNVVKTDNSTASVDLLLQEQQLDETLKTCWALLKRNKGGYYMKNGLLYKIENVAGCKNEALLIPSGRRTQVLKLAHEMFGGHLASVKTRDRIRLSGMTWPTLISDCKAFTRSCKQCQLRSRVTCFDRVKIKAIERADEVYNHWFMDCLGPLFPNQNVQFNYAIVLVDSYSRWPVAYPLRSLSAKHVCDALLQLFMQTA